MIPYQQYFSKVLVTGEVTSVVEKEAWPLETGVQDIEITIRSLQIQPDH